MVSIHAAGRFDSGAVFYLDIAPGSPRTGLLPGCCTPGTPGVVITSDIIHSGLSSGTSPGILASIVETTRRGETDAICSTSSGANRTVFNTFNDDSMGCRDKNGKIVGYCGINVG